MLFSELCKSMVNKVTLAGFRGAITPHWILPWMFVGLLLEVDVFKWRPIFFSFLNASLSDSCFKVHFLRWKQYEVNLQKILSWNNEY